VKRLPGILGIVVVSIVLFALVAASRRQAATPPVYSVEQVILGLRSHPARWFGRTIRLRAMLAGVITAGDAPLTYLVGRLVMTPMGAAHLPDPPAATGWGVSIHGPLIISPEVPGASRNPVVAFLRRFFPPGSGTLHPHLDGRGMGTFRLRLIDVSKLPGCISHPCYRAVLQDTVPSW